MFQDGYEDYGKLNPEVEAKRVRMRERLKQIMAEHYKNEELFNQEYDQVLDEKRVGVALPDGFHGRWENLSLFDLQWLKNLNVDIE